MFLFKFILIILPLVFGQDELCRFQSTNPALPSNWSFTSAAQVRLCFQASLFNRTVALETLKQLINSLDFYSFLNLVRQSGGPYFMNVDLRQELTQIRNEIRFGDDYQFHMKIVETFNKLNDYHTRYTAPQGYGRFYLVLPFIFQYFPRENQIRIEKVVKIYSTLQQQTLNQYVGRVLTKIDGIDALEYLKAFARQQSLMSKDFTVKLNSVFRREFWLRNLAQNPIPTSNNMTLTFDRADGSTIVFPYLIVSTKKFNDQQEFKNENQFSLTADSIIIDEDFLEFFKLEDLQWYSKVRSPDFQLIEAAQRTFYHRQRSKDVAIIRLESFDELYFDEIKRIISKIQGKTLIIDLIGNQGGYSCLAYALLHYLVPEYFNLSRLYEPMDGRTTKSLRTFSSAFQLFPGSILNLQTNLPFDDLQWIEPFVNLTRGPTTEEYSMKWSINCDSFAFGEGKFWMRNQTASKYFSSIYVLTDGTCGSACSLFLSKLRFASNFRKIYGLGGGYFNVSDELFESSSYAGGGAFPWNQIVSFYQMQSTDQNSSVNYLPTSAHLNINVYEIYINAINKDYPREFVKQSIDKRLLQPSFFDMEDSIKQIIKDHSNSYGENLAHNYLLLILLLFLIGGQNKFL